MIAKTFSGVATTNPVNVMLLNTNLTCPQSERRLIIS
jgi:hypothetical protein